MDKREKHNARTSEFSRRKRDQSPLKECECGCGAMIHSLCRDGKPRRFAIGHGGKKERVNEWGQRRRARAIKGRGECELEHIGGVWEATD